MFVPEAVDGFGGGLGVFPAVGEGGEGVAAADEFGADVDDASGGGSLEPAFEDFVGEVEPVAEFGGEPAARGGDGYLAMVAVEGAEMKLVGVLDEACLAELMGALCAV